MAFPTLAGKNEPLQVPYAGFLMLENYLISSKNDIQFLHIL